MSILELLKRVVQLAIYLRYLQYKWVFLGDED